MKIWVHLAFYPLHLWHDEGMAQLSKKISSIYEITGYNKNGLNVQLLPALYITKMMTVYPFSCLGI